MKDTKNAKIVSTELGLEDHGIMTFFLHLNYGGSQQGAGGYALDTPIKENGKFFKRIGTVEGMSLIMEVLRVVGVRKWEDLPGKAIRATAEHHKIYAIGHYLQDEWLDFSQFIKKTGNYKKLIKEE